MLPQQRRRRATVAALPLLLLVACIQPITLLEINSKAQALWVLCEMDG